MFWAMAKRMEDIEKAYLEGLREGRRKGREEGVEKGLKEAREERLKSRAGEPTPAGTASATVATRHHVRPRVFSTLTAISESAILDPLEEGRNLCVTDDGIFDADTNELIASFLRDNNGNVRSIILESPDLDDINN